MKMGDCLAALGQRERAAEVYRAVGFYCIKAGHPLSALVAARVASESLGAEDDDILAALVVTYGSESSVTGSFAARLHCPDDETEVDPAGGAGAGVGVGAGAGAGVGGDPIAELADLAIHGTDGFQGFPEVVHPVPLLSALSEQALRRVLDTLVVRRLPARVPIIREGEPGQSFFFLADGQVVVFDTDSLGVTRELATLGEGAIFGEMALLSARPRSASVAATVETDLLEVTRGSLAALADELPAVAAALQKFTYERMLQNLMARSPLFKPFNKAQQRDLLRRFTSHDVAAGTDIIREGDPGAGLFVVLQGEVEVTKGDGEDTLDLATLRPGDVFGEMSLLQASAATATVTAATPATVLFLSRDYVDRMVANIPAIRDYLAALADDRTLDTQLQMRAVGEAAADGSIVILF